MRLETVISDFKEKITKLNDRLQELQNTKDQQISLIDPDARSMSTNRSGKGNVGYNVQSSVDTKHHLIVAHEVTNIPSDRGLLSKMAKVSKDILHTDKLTVVADRGYFKSEEIKLCHDAGIVTYVPKPRTSGNKAKGLFDKADFIYHPEDDSYECPAGQKAIYRFTTIEKGMSNKRYWSSACVGCPEKEKCTTGVNRRITRWEHESILDEMSERLNLNPNVITIRKSTVEHPFGTIKAWMGSTHFLMKTLPRVSAEMSLHVLAYNLTRVMNMIGSKQLIKAIQA
jgi:hypothetical protein